jgi:hypothetical protein
MRERERERRGRELVGMVKQCTYLLGAESNLGAQGGGLTRWLVDWLDISVQVMDVFTLYDIYIG